MTGYFDALLFYRLALDVIAGLFTRLPRKPRYMHDAPRTFAEVTRLVVEECEGDAVRLWASQRAAPVRRALLEIHGVGPGIASMVLLLIERAYSIRFSDLDHSRMDIKPDVHTVRVLYRLGAAPTMQESAAISAARTLNPSFPGDIDEPLWLAGRKWCTAANPSCTVCPLHGYCPQIGVASAR